MALTILIPVYRDLASVRACVESVLRDIERTDVETELLVIDDASPEEDVAGYVARLPEVPSPVPTRTVRNDENLGFVGTVNRGMALCDADVLLLNSDTVVAAGAIDRMVAAVRAREDVATVTPLTTFGSICTIPEDVQEAFGPLATREDVDRVGRFIADWSPRLRPSVITGVGFAMLIVRSAWQEVGPFDARTYGRGYGEEVDFCLRASRAGYVHVVADDAFVHHEGGASFGSQGRIEGLRRSSRLLHARYPFFRAANAAERSADPLAPTFAMLRFGLRPRDARRPHVLQVLHSRPGSTGGTESHSEILMSELEADYDFSILFPERGGAVLRTRWRRDNGLNEHEFLLPAAAERAIEPLDPNAGIALRTALDLLDFDAVHIQNLIGHSLSALAVLEDFEGPVVYNLRDLYLVCPHHWLLYRNETHCNVPQDLDVCATCLPLTRGMEVDVLAEHRERVAELLPVIDHIVAASPDSVDYLRAAYDVPDDQVEVIEHGAIVDLGLRRRSPDVGLIMREPLRVAYAGQARKKKGIDTVAWLAEDLAAEEIEVHAFGEEKESVGAHVVTHGTYSNDELPDLLDAAGIHVVLLPGPYAETFGHVMTEAMIAGRPVIATQYGALAERLRRDGTGWVVDPDNPAEIATLLRHIDRDRDELLRRTTRVMELDIRHTRDTVKDYARLYMSDAGHRRGDGTLSELEGRLRRQVQALSLVAAQEANGAAARSTGRRDSEELRQTQKTLRSREREIARLKDAYAEARNERRHAQQELSSIRGRRSVRLALRVARVLRR